MNPRDPFRRSSAYPYTTGAARQRLAAARMQAARAARRRALVSAAACVLSVIIVIIVIILAVAFIRSGAHCGRTYTQGNTTVTSHCRRGLN